MVSLSNHVAISMGLDTCREPPLLVRRDCHPRIKYGVAMTKSVCDDRLLL